MKERLQTLVNNKIFKIFAISVLWIMIIVPLLSQFHLLTRTNRINWVFLIINNLIAMAIGRYIRINKLSFWTFLIFPLVFVLETIIKYGVYGYTFALVYLVVEALAYALTDNRM